ncbi:hypothetical protein GEMRC1_000244 [Eukaryota sp. GEM-RC1]
MRHLLFFALVVCLALAASHNEFQSLCENGLEELDRVDPNCVGRVVERREEPVDEEEDNNNGNNNNNNDEPVLNDKPVIYTIAGSRMFPLRFHVPVHVRRQEENNNNNGEPQKLQENNNNNRTGDVFHILDARQWNALPTEEVRNVTKDTAAQLGEENPEVRQGYAYFNGEPQIEQKLTEDQEAVVEAIEGTPVEEENNNNNGQSRMYDAIEQVLEQADFDDETPSAIVVITEQELNNNNDGNNNTQKKSKSKMNVKQEQERRQQLRQQLQERDIYPIFAVPQERQQEYQQLVQDLETGNVVVVDEDTTADDLVTALEETLDELAEEEEPLEGEYIITVEVEEEVEGVFFEPIKEEIRVVLGKETNNNNANNNNGEVVVPVFFHAYTEECNPLLDIIARETESVNVTIRVQRAENGNNNNGNNNQEQQIQVYLFRCPCLSVHIDPKCGFFMPSHMKRPVQVDREENGNNNNKNNN